LLHSQSRLRSSVFAAPLLALVACTGGIDAAGPGSSSGGAPSGSGGGPSNAGTSAVSPSDCSAIHPGPTRVRRLNRFEYDNTVADLLGDTSRPARQFPTEERSHLGLDNDAGSLTVSPVLVEQYQLAAEKLAATAVTQLDKLLGCDAASAGEEACAKQFIDSFGAKAFRRPLAADESARLLGVYQAGRAQDFASGIRMVVEALLQSPAFLYRVEFGATPASGGREPVRLTSWEMASRLSYLLWQSMPDETLRQAALQDTLTTDAALTAQVERMLADPRARKMVEHFHEVWLSLDEYATLEKDPQIFPAFTGEIASLMAQETRTFLDHLVWDGEGDVGSMFTAPYSFMNQKLLDYYGGKGVTGDTFMKVTLDPTQRLGLLTQGGLLASLAKANQTGPVQRGKFIREQFLCMDMPPPPAGVDIKVPDLSPTLSTRERFSQHSADATCQGCHTLMDPIGLALENFDGAGRYRTAENGKAIDVTGEIFQADVPGAFMGAAGLAHKLAESPAVKACIGRAWFQYAYGRADTVEDTCTIGSVQQKFASAGYKIKDLIIALTQSDAFRYRTFIPAGAEQ
jgi:hypothetical protein